MELAKWRVSRSSTSDFSQSHASYAVFKILAFCNWLFFHVLWSYVYFLLIVSDWEEIQNDPMEMEFIEIMSSYFCKAFKGLADYSDIIGTEQLGIIHGRIRINNMTIFGTYGDKLGVGLYLSGSALDHSCLPNACPSFSGTLLTIQTTDSVDGFEKVWYCPTTKLSFHSWFWKMDWR